MEKQKHIEEMAKDMHEGHIEICDNTPFDDCPKNCHVCNAKAFYERGYRKIPENAVVLAREEYEELQKGVKTHNYTAMFNAQNADRWLDGLKQGFKEGVEALAIQIKERIHYNENISQDTDDCLCEEIDNLCAELLNGLKTGEKSKGDEIPDKNDKGVNSGDECVSCGKYAGEGRHVCVNCEKK